MNLKDIFLKNPDEQTLLNQGVVSVNDSADAQSLRVLQYEVSTFVCKGQYHKGLLKILENFNTNLAAGREQKAVWISGFFGSGKSHLAKILRALWVNQEFPDGQRALDVVTLPQDVRDQFLELKRNADRHGGLYAVSGTLSAGVSDFVRMTVLSMMFRSKGLPERYNQARFCLWLRDEGVLDDVKADIASKGRDFSREVGNMMVSSVLWESVLKAIPSLGSVDSLKAQLREQFKNQDDVSDAELVDIVKRTLSDNGQFPLTLIVLDEVQQFLNFVDDRSRKVQELVETMSKGFGSKILFVGTGQNALAGTSYLQHLMGRFPVPVDLSDNDVDTVVRENILKKRPDKEPAVRNTIDAAQGEIDSHLFGTQLAPQRYEQEDKAWIVADYPLLPVRRRFWETALKSADRTGTASQLRNQLRMVFEAIKVSKDEKLGYVVPSDFIYDQNVVSFEQTGILPRELRSTIEGLRASENPKEAGKGRILSLIFLLGKINEGQPTDRIPCTVKTLEDLLVTDLSNGHDQRERVEAYCGELVRDGHLMRTGDEYQVQTKEGTRWTQEFRRNIEILANNPDQLAQLRRDQLYRHLETALGRLSVQQGNVRVTRAIGKTTDRSMPSTSEPLLWIRNGWDTEEDTAHCEIRQAGMDSPLISVFLPKLSNDQIKTNLMEWKAAEKTIEYFGTQTSVEGRQAFEAMQTRKISAENALKALWSEIIDQAKVWIGGGTEISGLSVSGKVDDAIDKALTRTYPDFSKGDNPKWSDVIDSAQKGSTNCLERIGFAGDPKEQPVCAEILRQVNQSSNWNEIRSHFEKGTYGWPRDTIDGALYALWINGLIAVRKAGRELTVGEIPRKDIGSCPVVTQIIIITTSDKIKIRSVYRDAGVESQGGEELAKAQDFRKQLEALRQNTGGDAPLPAVQKPDWWDALDSESGLAYLKYIAENDAKLKEAIQNWKKIDETKNARLSEWKTYDTLLGFAAGLPDYSEWKANHDAVFDGRSLLRDPDPVPSLLHAVREALHEALKSAYKTYSDAFILAQETLESSSMWNRLSESQRNALIAQVGFEAAVEPKRGAHRH